MGLRAGGGRQRCGEEQRSGLAAGAPRERGPHAPFGPEAPSTLPLSAHGATQQSQRGRPRTAIATRSVECSLLFGDGESPPSPNSVQTLVVKLKQVP